MLASTLRIGAKGTDVELLQQALLEAHFSPGKIDGNFAAATGNALMAFQRSKGLLADGVAGPVTLRALGLMGDDAVADPVTGLSVQLSHEMCPGAPLPNIRTHLPNVISSLIAQNLEERPMVLMAIATIRVETGAFLPISEGESHYNTAPGGPLFGLYDHRPQLGNDGAGEGARFRGRGFIQLTGRFNYRKFGRLLTPAIDLEQFPERANESLVAADLLCLFLNANKPGILAALANKDFRKARSLVNGGSHGLEDFIDSYVMGTTLMLPSLPSGRVQVPGPTPH